MYYHLWLYVKPDGKGSCTPFCSYKNRGTGNLLVEDSRKSQLGSGCLLGLLWATCWWRIWRFTVHWTNLSSAALWINQNQTLIVLNQNDDFSAWARSIPDRAITQFIGLLFVNQKGLSQLIWFKWFLLVLIYVRIFCWVTSNRFCFFKLDCNIDLTQKTLL